MAADRLLLRNLVFRGRLGVGEEERAGAQEIEVDLELEVDADRAAASDSIGDTVDYMAIAARVGAVVREADARLVEHLASRIADEVLTDERVRGVTVELRKRAAALPGLLARAGVRLVRP